MKCWSTQEGTAMSLEDHKLLLFYDLRLRPYYAKHSSISQQLLLLHKIIYGDMIRAIKTAV